MENKMKKSLIRILLVLVIITLPYFAGSAQACSCFATPSPYKAYQDATAVFIGKVVSSKDVPYEESIGDKKFTVYERHFHFIVEESFKDTKESEIDISVGRVDSSCYQGFAIGESYLVYAYGNSGNILGSGACTRTNNLKWAFDDVHYIRAMVRGAPEPRIYGAVARIGNDPGSESALVEPLGGVKILIKGEKNQHFEALTDKQGFYSVTKIPDGRYKIRPVLPAKYMSYYPAEEEVFLDSQGGIDYEVVKRGRSVYARFDIGWNNRISGRVLDAEGQPVERAVVRLLPVERAADKMKPMFESIADHLGKDGKYVINGKTPGRYILAVEVYAPFVSGAKTARTYYPQAGSPEKAEVIVLGETAELNLDIKLLPGQVIRQIEGSIVWSDGSPVTKNGHVFLEKLGDSEDKNNVRYDLESVDGQGRFTVQVFENAEYFLNAEVGTLGVKFGNTSGDLWDQGIREIKAQPIKLKVSKDMQPLKIIIPLPEGLTAPKQ
jgi:hypothetical protein